MYVVRTVLYTCVKIKICRRETQARAFLDESNKNKIIKLDNNTLKRNHLSNFLATMAKTTNKKKEAAAAKAKRELKIPRGVMQKVFAEHKEIYTWLTINLVKKGLEKAKKNEVIVTESANISDLTNPTFEDNNQDSNEPAVPPTMNQEQELPPELPPETSKRKGGRPRGTTIKATMEKEAKRESLINDIAMSWSEKVEQERTTGEKNRMKRNELDGRSLLQESTITEKPLLLVVGTHSHATFWITQRS